LGLFIDGLMKLRKKELEEKKNTMGDRIEGDLYNTFGIGTDHIFKSIHDAEGNLRHIVFFAALRVVQISKIKMV
jgi:hypothetical protein